MAFSRRGGGRHRNKGRNGRQKDDEDDEPSLGDKRSRPQHNSKAGARRPDKEGRGQVHDGRASKAARHKDSDRPAAGDSRAEKTDSRADKDDEDDDDDEEEEEESAYDKLMESLRRQGEHKKALEQRRREEEGVDMHDPSEDEEESEEEDGEDVDEGEGSDEEGLASQDDDDDDEQDNDDEDDDDDDDEEEMGGGEGEEGEDDREAGREELGLDATHAESDDEDDDVGDAGSDEEQQRNDDDDDEDEDSFTRCFTKAQISESEAARAQEERLGIKWRKRTVQGLPRGVLYRPGFVARELPEAVQEGGEDALKISAGLLERLAATHGGTAKSNGKDKNGGGGKGGQERKGVKGSKVDKKGRGSEKEVSKEESQDVRGVLTEVQRALLPLLSDYMDVLYSARTAQTADQLRDVLVLHTLNHVIKSRDCISRNNKRLKKGSITEARDQGYTRAKVLILLPCRNSAYAFTKRLLHVYPGANAPVGRVDGGDRFEEEFGPGDKAERAADQERLGRVGPDHYERFHGNNDDHFRFGVQLHKKYARLFAPFYSSDILVASPLGLRMVVKSKDDKGRETDFLSSIEVVLIDQMEYHLMQNFDHMATLLEALNLSPFKSRGADFTRLREYFLDNNQRYFRQTVVLSQHTTPESNALINRQSFNVRGTVKLNEEHKGSVRHVLPHMHIRQVFHRLGDAKSLAESDDLRFEFFRDHVYSRISQTSQSHTLVFVSSYLEYVRLRNYLNKLEASFIGCNEYASVSDVARGRSEFFHGRVNMLLVTERFHFYYRFRLRGIQHAVFYSLPSSEGFYPELINLVSMGEDTGGTVTVLFGQHDRLALQRIIGTTRAERLLTSDKATHMFS